LSRKSLAERRKKAQHERNKNVKKPSPEKSGSAALLVVMAALMVTAIVAFTQLYEEGGEGRTFSIQWIHDYEEGMDNASESERPAMVYFHTEWCTYCEKMENDTFSKERIVLKSERFTAIQVDGDERQDLVEKYDISGFPTVVFVDPEENELHRAVGYRDANEFHADMNTALENF